MARQSEGEQVTQRCRARHMSRLHLVGGDRRFGSGVIDLPTFQKYLNFHYSVTLDLFGAEVSYQRRGGLHQRTEGPLPRVRGSMTITG